MYWSTSVKKHALFVIGSIFAKTCQFRANIIFITITDAILLKQIGMDRHFMV